MSKVIAAYGGGFKPPTKGHFEVVTKALNDFPEVDEFIIYVGGGERGGINQAQSILIWEIYQTYLPMKVKIEPSKAPIGDIIRLGKNNLQDEVYFVIGAREGFEDDMKDVESRTKNIEEKYPNMKVKVITTPDKGISGTNARKASQVSYDDFVKYIPSELSDSEKEEVYDIVKPSISETNNPEDGKAAPYGSGYNELNEDKTTHKVIAKGVIFSPKNITINVGDTVEWINEEGYHNVNGKKSHSRNKNNPTSFGNKVGSGWTYKFTFTKPGTYKYHCDPHLSADMVGTVKVKEVLNEDITQSQLNALEAYADNLFAKLGIDIEFTRHFLDRVNDERNIKPISIPELIGMFKRLHKKHGKPLSKIDNDFDAVVKDFNNNINIPFAINVTPEDIELVAKTVMRKKDFKTSTPVIPLEENASYSQDIDIKSKIMQLTQHMLDKGMNIEPLPKVEFVDGDSDNAREFLGKTAYYNPNNNTIVLYTEGRHPKDITRSFSHEMIHHIQNLEGRLGDITTTNTQEDDHLNNIEAEANLKGTMTFRNWTDSLNEANKPYKHKHGFDDKLGKDPFGISAYARELALGLEEEIEEGRKKKKDPKKGTGKKPKKSERRLYTDEDPKDTIGIKFSTRQDIVDTLNKKSFKAKSHARQSQIINLIHQRVRAAYGRAKDPAVKKRLKSGLDYITKKKEASKAKTQRLKKLKEGDTYEKMAAKGKKAGSLKQGTVRKRLGIPKDKKIPLSLINKEIARLKKMDKDPDKKGAQLGDKNQKYYKALQLSKTLKTTTNLNEGRYDTLANKLSSIAFETFKNTHDKGDKEGEFEFRVDHPDDEHDIPSKDFSFDFIGKVEITDDEYAVDGGANAGFDNEGEEIIPLLSVKFKIPKNPDWQEVSFDIKDVVRHELEHLTQDGENLKPSKYIEDDQLVRDLINAKMLPKSQYFKLEGEVDAMLQGMYFKAKKSRQPFGKIINNYLDIFVDGGEITSEEKEDILKVWRNRGKALSLPLFEQTEEQMNYTIYSDMDGVLTDFDIQFMKASEGIIPSEYKRNFGTNGFWDLIEKGGVGYWAGMPWMSDGKKYWDYIKKYNPLLLSSPSASEPSRLGKRVWVKNNLPGTKLILARSTDKQKYADENSILIDDRPSNIDQWRSQGGIGILHVSAEDTIQQLKKLGL